MVRSKGNGSSSDKGKTASLLANKLNKGNNRSKRKKKPQNPKTARTPKNAKSSKNSKPRPTSRPGEILNSDRYIACLNRIASHVLNKPQRIYRSEGVIDFFRSVVSGRDPVIPLGAGSHGFLWEFQDHIFGANAGTERIEGGADDDRQIGKLNQSLNPDEQSNSGCSNGPQNSKKARGRPKKSASPQKSGYPVVNGTNDEQLQLQEVNSDRFSVSSQKTDAGPGEKQQQLGRGKRAKRRTGASSDQEQPPQKMVKGRRPQLDKLTTSKSTSSHIWGFGFPDSRNGVDSGGTIPPEEPNCPNSKTGQNLASCVICKRSANSTSPPAAEDLPPEVGTLYGPYLYLADTEAGFSQKGKGQQSPGSIGGGGISRRPIREQSKKERKSGGNKAEALNLPLGLGCCGTTDRQVVGPRPGTGKGGEETVKIYIHEGCALASVDIGMLGSTLYGVEVELAKSMDKICTLCRRPNAALDCLARGCSTQWHFPCALQSGCTLVPENVAVRCKFHENQT